MPVFTTKADIMTISELPLKSKPKSFNLSLKFCCFKFLLETENCVLSCCFQTVFQFPRKQRLKGGEISFSRNHGSMNSLMLLLFTMKDCLRDTQAWRGHWEVKVTCQEMVLISSSYKTGPSEHRNIIICMFGDMDKSSIWTWVVEFYFINYLKLSECIEILEMDL